MKNVTNKAPVILYTDKETTVFTTINNHSDDFNGLISMMHRKVIYIYIVRGNHFTKYRFAVAATLVLYCTFLNFWRFFIFRDLKMQAKH